MGKCPYPRCKWEGPADKYQKHVASKHYKPKPKKGGRNVNSKGRVIVFKKPGFVKAKKKR